MPRFRLFHLTLRRRTALYFSIGLTAVILSTLLITRYFFLYSINELEDLELERANKQAFSVIQMMTRQLEERSYDWAYWDDTYQLFTERNIEEYRELNLFQDSLDTLGLDLMAFVTVQGELIESLVRDDSAVISPDLVTQAVQNQNVQSHLHEMRRQLDGKQKSLSGLERIGERIWLFSLTPVRNSEGSSAVAGWLIWGQDLSSRFPGGFADILSSDNELDVVMPGYAIPSEAHATGADKWLQKNALYLTAWTPVTDLADHKIAYLKTQQPRVYYQKGSDLFVYLIAVVSSVTGLIAVATFFLFNNRISTRFEALMRAKGERKIECLVELTPIHHENQQALMISLSDLSEQKKQERMIKDLVGRDPLSGLYNRPAILAKLDQLIETEPTRFSFLYISIEKLKQISEVYGHLVFDDVVKHVASVFGKALNGFDVGRISEFEFIAIIPEGKQYDEALMGANRFMDILAKAREVSGIELDLNSKVAVIDPSLSDQPLGYLLQAAAYTIQTYHHDRVTEVIQITKATADKAQHALMISRDIVTAVRENAIIAYYQPIVDTESGKVGGFEALARWIHPELGFVSPEIFVHLAEQNQLIVELGESIVRQACRFLSTLNRQREEAGLLPLSVHVNLSAIHFYHARLPAYLRQVMAEFDIAPGLLVVEITESTLLGIESETLDRMTEIKSLGVQLALDDFGTGYSSFSTLCSFPLDIVKLDKSYIDQLENNDRARTLIRSIAGMAKELGLTTVAEGVETASQLRKLKTWNIDEIQGYYFYKPLPEQEAMEKFCGDSRNQVAS
ncbi:bifunctional diguanylate cyclase/phosphodiesterase [Vibrio navarrensis]|uniref:bifunctional diguanylate cyclase/phosphodiesterase n=1 Tax=Vibrio navarrensis TaxID=29495 RepID=UPI0018698F11|nr:bifunctional diguanylate cyclase/phosphodiesterase [Vibrio navarrensis]MBE4606153.1 sensor domain-containing phosphodiesterase [Vibrio navarrensis]MBE4610176.1 sensor domain-containing phosphodiesterase [Vibrio navarrensis]